MSGLKVLIGGTRHAKATHGPAVWNVIAKEVPVPGDMTVIHGGARGVDAIADAIARGYLMLPPERIIVCPADWETHGKAAGPIRNEQMLVEHQPDLVLAFPSTLHPSRGTNDMVLRAKRHGVRTVVTWLS